MKKKKRKIGIFSSRRNIRLRLQERIDIFLKKVEIIRLTLGEKFDRILTGLTYLSLLTLILVFIYVFVSARKNSRVEWIYFSHDVNIEQVINSPFEIVIIDYKKDGKEGGELSKVDIARIKASGKKVLSYITLDTAQSYRFYWKDEWNTTLPDFIIDKKSNNSDYNVKYWEEAWKNILYKGKDNYVEKLLSLGFDGIDLIVSKEKNLQSGEIDTRQKMIDLITEVAVEIKKINPHAQVYLHNKIDLAEEERVLNVIDGVVKESLLFSDGVKRPENEIKKDIDILDKVVKAKKIVLVSESISQKNEIKEFCTFTAIRRYIPHIEKGDDIENVKKGCS